MAFYRYSASYPSKDGEITVRSLLPFSPDNEKTPYFCHRFYTSEKDDSSYYYVVSLGHERAWPDRDLPPRTTDRFIIHYVIKGTGWFQGEEVHGGQFFFTHPYETYSIHSSKASPLEFYYIGLAGPGTEDLMKRAGFLTIPKIWDFHFENKLCPMFHDALYNVHHDRDTELYLIGMFMHLLSFHREENVQLQSEQTKMDAFHYYKEALQFVQDYLLEGITPRDVAQHLHISPSYLRVIFSKYCKYSLRELLIRKRVECAASRLTFEDASVTQVAALVGYSDYTLFSKIFKKYTGLSPIAYKKKKHTDVTFFPENIDAPRTKE